MARTTKESLELLRTSLDDIKTSLTNKEVVVDSLKASQVPDKIREIQTTQEYTLKYSSSSYLLDGFSDAKPTKLVFTNQKAPSSSKTIDCSADNDGTVVRWYDTNTTTLYISTQENNKKVKLKKRFYFSNMNDEIKNIVEIDFTNVDTSQLTDMSYFFSNCQELLSLDLSSFDTKKVTDMSIMFRDCSKLKEIKFSETFDTSNVTNMEFMFSGCRNLQKIDFPKNFNTSNVTNMSNMFNNCRSLTSLNLSNFNTKKVFNMRYMFFGIQLETLDLSSFDTSKVYDMTSMFEGASNLQILDLSNFTLVRFTSSSCTAKQMFFSCSKLSTIYAKEWANENPIGTFGSLFQTCSHLPNYSSSNLGISMAKWKENGGYFTNPADKPS